MIVIFSAARASLAEPAQPAATPVAHTAPSKSVRMVRRFVSILVSSLII